jgi:hypothetical protein
MVGNIGRRANVLSPPNQDERTLTTNVPGRRNAVEQSHRCFPGFLITDSCQVAVRELMDS